MKLMDFHWLDEINLEIFL